MSDSLPPPPLEAPSQRYKVLKKIDSGGMAEIYLARSNTIGDIGKTVVIKRVHPNLVKNQRFVNMFLDEARLSMCLNHANIVPVFDVGFADDTYFIVMEYVEGTTLRRLFQRSVETGKHLSVQDAVFIAIEVCKGLAHAHDKIDENGNRLNIVHRDISPPNVLISKSGEVKITDFGLAKAKTQLELTDPGVVKGKFSYLSPEAAEGEVVDHRADLFAVGILAWESLAGRRLFLGKSDLETVELVRKADVPTLSLFNADVTLELVSILEKALARDPKKRFNSAQELGDALSGYLFSHNLKVTNFDIAEAISAIESQDDTEPLSQRIERLIDSELENISSMQGADSEPITLGARPLNELDFSNGNDKHLLSVEDIWTPTHQEPVPANAYLADMLEHFETHAGGTMELPKDENRSKIKTIMLVAFLCAVSAAAIATTWFLVDYFR